MTFWPMVRQETPDCSKGWLSHKTQPFEQLGVSCPSTGQKVKSPAYWDFTFPGLDIFVNDWRHQ